VGSQLVGSVAMAMYVDVEVASGAKGGVSGTLKNVFLVHCVKDNKRFKFIDL